MLECLKDCLDGVTVQVEGEQWTPETVPILENSAFRRPSPVQFNVVLHSRSNLSHLPTNTMADVIESMLDLMRRLPPTRTQENVEALVNICPDEADELLQNVDQPLSVLVDQVTGREYLACDYNRDGGSYRYSLSHSNA